MSDVPERSPTPTSLRWFACIFGLLFLSLSVLEANRLRSALDDGPGFIGWLTFWDMETTAPWLLMLTLLVMFCVIRRPGVSDRIRPPAAAGADRSPSSATGRTFLSACVIFTVSFGCSWQVGSRQVSVQTMTQKVLMPLAELPPAYHDEYSYLLQARTFLNGRLAWPGMDVRPDLFHQFHVLNEYRTVSRYFPWTGLWIAPFEAIGKPFAGHWMAGALSAVMFFLALNLVTPPRVAFWGGMLIAVSPGVAVFSNMLLAHHPTMLALSVFTWAFFRMMKTRQMRFAFVAGFGLTLAMLARPMTAAGFGLPFGIWLGVRMISEREWRRLATGFAVPLLAGFCFLAILNSASTGSWKRTAYQEYTERYTPRHGYGFNNAVDKPVPSAPSAIQKYDEWAFNLTIQRAADNVALRFFYSLVWSLSVAPVLLGLGMAAPRLFASGTVESGAFRRTELRLLAFAIFTMHVAHLPYWYAGIMNWHYVFETAPLLLLLTAVGLVATVDVLQHLFSRRMAGAWVVAFVLAGLLPGWFRMAAYDDTSKVAAAVSQLSFSRVKFEVFNQSVAHKTITKPALIMVDEADSDPQLSYIINPPDLDADVLVCRLPEASDKENRKSQVRELHRRFPDRYLYTFDPKIQQFTAAAGALE